MNKRLKIITSCRQARQMIPPILYSNTNWLIGNNRRTTNPLVGVLTGHCRLKKNLTVMRIEERATCPKCQEAEDTTFHLWTVPCNGKNAVGFGVPQLTENEIQGLQWREILSFITNKGRFVNERILMEDLGERYWSYLR